MIEVGSQVGGYLIEGVLGHGGMGVVYEARQIALNRLVALKLLASQLGMDPSFRQRFRHEGRIQAAIDHPHIVTVFEAGEIEEGLYLVMRLIRGPTLKDMIIARELEGARTLRILTPIADALDAAHDAGLIHRDIKPQNILVGQRDHAYLADFGLTKGVDDVGLTRTGQFVGTIDYISPEQIRGEQGSACSDVYSMAAVLYECLTGVVPYPKPSDAAVMYSHLSEPPPMVTDQRPELPAALDEVLARGMAKDPDDRHPSAGELMEDATRAFGKRVRAAITPPDPIEHPSETGIRDDESQVPTRPTRVRSASQAKEQAEIVLPAAAGTRPSPAVEQLPPLATPAEAAAPTTASPQAAPAAPTTASPQAAPAAPTTASPQAAPAAPTTASPQAAPAAPTTASPQAAPAAPTTASPQAAPAAPTTASPQAAPAAPTTASPQAAPAAPTTASPQAAPVPAPATAKAAPEAPPAETPPAQDPPSWTEDRPRVARGRSERPSGPQRPPAPETRIAPPGRTGTRAVSSPSETRSSPPAAEPATAASVATTSSERPAESVARASDASVATPDKARRFQPQRDWSRETGAAEQAGPAPDTQRVRPESREHSATRVSPPLRREQAFTSDSGAIRRETGESAAGLRRTGPDRASRLPVGAILGAALVAVLVAVAAGYLVGRPGESEPAPTTRPAPLTGSAAAGGLVVGFPSDWETVGDPPEIPGLALDDAVALAPQGTDDQGLAAAILPGEGTSLLPPGLSRRLAGAPSTDDRVRLGDLEAIRHRSLEVDGLDDVRLRVFSAPTTAGVATIVCWSGASAAERFAPSCDRIAQTVRLLRAEPVALGPNAAYAGSVSRAVRSLNGRRARARTQLARAGNQRRQARAADELARVHRRASRAVAAVRPHPEAAPGHRAIAGSLRNLTVGYERLARAARGNDTGAYRAAAAAVRRQDAALQRSLQSHERLGYRLR